MNDKMKRITHFDIALRLAGYNFGKQHVELIMKLYDLTKSKGGKVTVSDVVDLQTEVDEKYGKEIA
jgi:hypothetical protein